jgi:hypothetical protein
MFQPTWAKKAVLFLVVAFSIVMAVACSGSDDAPPVVIPPPTPTPEAGTVSVAMPVRSIGSLKLLGLPVTVAGRQSELLLDTGSAGVRILASAAGTFGLVRTAVPDQVSFADGTVFRGVVATAPFQIGSVSSETPISIQLIDEVSCIDGTDDCSKSIFDGSGFFSGIIGTSLNRRTETDDLFSPVPLFPGNFDTGYVIRTGGFTSRQGFFVLGLTPSNTAGFGIRNLPQEGDLTFPDGTPIWDDEALEVAYTLRDPQGNTIVNNSLSRTVFDTGSSDISLSLFELGGSLLLDRVLPPRSTFRALLTGAFDYGLQVGSRATPGLDRVFLDFSGDFQLVGMPIFFQFDVFFDIEQGRIGFKRI